MSHIITVKGDELVKITRFLANEKIYYGTIQDDVVQVIEGDIYGKFQITKQTFDLQEVKLLAPVEPGKVIGVGLNYLAHISEFNRKPEAPEEPVIFMVSPTAIIGPEEEIILPYPEHENHHEAELVVVIGKEARSIPREMVNDYIFGYTCGNDVSDRNLQKADKQWIRAKGFHTFKPLGPWIETQLNSTNLNIQSRVNGQLRQDSNTAKMLHDVSVLVSFISHIMTLYPGDVIYTGTPEGVGPLNAGDVCEIEISGIGILRNPVSTVSGNR